MARRRGCVNAGDITIHSLDWIFRGAVSLFKCFEQRACASNAFVSRWSVVHNLPDLRARNSPRAFNCRRYVLPLTMAI